MNDESLPMAKSTLLFGATSILGFHLATSFPKTIVPFISPGNASPAVARWPPLRLNDPTWLKTLFRRSQLQLLLYCHAVCDVAKCEAYSDWAFDINVRQVDRVLSLLPDDVRLVYVSSDHVFGGNGVYRESSSACPISEYGRTRVEAERLVSGRPGSLIIRAGLGIGRSPDGRTGHLDWLRYRLLHHLPVTIIHDEFRSVVWMEELADRIMALAHTSETGIRHCPATRAVSRVELARFLVKKLGLPEKFTIQSRHQQPTPHLGRVELASEYGGELSHPLSSVLDDEAIAVERIG